MDASCVDTAPGRRSDGAEAGCAEPNDVFVIGAHSMLEMGAMEFLRGSNGNSSRDEEAIINAFANIALGSAPSMIGKFLPISDFIPGFNSISGSSVAAISSQPVETTDCSVAFPCESPRTTRLLTASKWAATLTTFLHVSLERLNTLIHQLRKGITSHSNYVKQ